MASARAAEVVRLLSERSWDTGLPLLADDLMEVWYYVPPTQLRSLLIDIPPALLARYPFVLYLRQLLGGRPLAAEMAHAGNAVAAAGSQPADMLSRMMHAGQLRLAGRTADAMEILESSLGVLRAAENPLIELESNMSAFAYLQAGITALLAGDLTAARAWLLRGGAAGADTRFGFVERDSAYKYALLQALFGDPAEANRSLLRGDACPRTASWAESWIDSTGELARALISLDDTHQPPPAPGSTWRAHGEMWPFELWYRVRLGMKRGDHNGTRALLTDVDAMNLSGADGDGLGAAVIPLGLASVELARGRASAAAAHIHRAPQGLLATRVLRARLDLARGRFENAAVEAAAGLVEANGLLRLTIELTGILAASQLALGETAEAHRTLTAVVNRRRVIPGALLKTLPAQLACAVSNEWASDADLAPILEEGNESLYPSQVIFIDLSDRELEVLGHLAGPMDRAAIADTLFVSENTLKSHVRSIYRKLAVSNRAQAVLAARSLGLLRPA